MFDEMAMVVHLVLILVGSSHALVSKPVAREVLVVNERLNAGRYGVVFGATLGNTPCIAKRAEAASTDEVDLAKAYLSTEAHVNEDIRQQPADRYKAHFATYLGSHVDGAGATWLVWERIDGAVSLDEFTGALPRLASEFGVTPRAALSGMVQSVAALHDLGYIHRDVKPENFLLDPSSALPTTAAAATDDNGRAAPAVGCLRLIDMGAAASVDSCSIIDLALGQCNDRLDPSTSPCTPLYAAPELYADPRYPFAFDVFSLGVSYLRLGLSALRTDAALEAFRAELAACDGRLDDWVRSRLRSTALDSNLAEELGQLFPGDAFSLVASMLRSDPARRPSVQALLAHPFLRDLGDDDEAGGSDGDRNPPPPPASGSPISWRATAAPSSNSTMRSSAPSPSPSPSTLRWGSSLGRWGRRSDRRPARRSPSMASSSAAPPPRLARSMWGTASSRSTAPPCATPPMRTLRSRCAAAWRRWPSAWSGAATLTRAM